MFKRALILLTIIAVPSVFATVCTAQQPATAVEPRSKIVSTPLAPAEIDRIIRAFSAKETGFRNALKNYAFKRDALVHTVSTLGKQVTGEYHRVSYFTFDDSGARFEKISFFPMPSLDGLIITPEDLEDLGGIQPFALETNKLSSYDFKYLGTERIDELDLYVFDVTPKGPLDQKRVSDRYFQGRIWVDKDDLQIVKTHGKGVPEGKQRFPTFDTYREQIDGKYWFPTYTYADEDLVFGSGQVVHMRMKVTYTNYVQTHADVKILTVDDAPPPPDQEQKPPATVPPSPVKKP